MKEEEGGEEREGRLERGGNRGDRERVILRAHSYISAANGS